MRLPIYLIGYMAAGKTTVGKLLAAKLGWRFVDLDEAFAEIHSQTPAEYIREHGIEEFRYREKYVLEDLAELPIEKVIYATGGGYPCWEDNMECLKELGTSIYLRWKPEHLAKRLMLTDLSTRPVLQGRTEQMTGLILFAFAISHIEMIFPSTFSNAMYPLLRAMSFVPAKMTTYFGARSITSLLKRTSM